MSDSIAHSTPPPLTEVSPALLDQVVQDYHDAGATSVITTKQPDGTYTVAATFNDNSAARNATNTAGASTTTTKRTSAMAQSKGNVAMPFIDLLIVREFEIDVDGAPNAYGPPGVGPTLDFELSAHVRANSAGAIVGYITNSDSSKPTQGATDPFPGYYISTTAFQDIANNNALDPNKYVDASKINYVVRGRVAAEHAVHLGDFVAVHSVSNNCSVFGIVGDCGNSSGAEGSLALLQALGYPFKSGKCGSVKASDIIVRYFYKSNPTQRFFSTQAQIDGTALQVGLSKDFSAHAS